MSTATVEQAMKLSPDKVGDRLLAIPEDQWFDRKSARVSARDLADAEIAFGNAEGGMIVVGLHNGEVEGTDDVPAHRNELMQAHIQYCDPPVRCQTRYVRCRRPDGSDDHLLAIEIQPGAAVHANKKDEVFLRVGDEATAHLRAASRAVVRQGRSDL